MLPEVGATEMLVIAAVALIVVGPKDLPLLLRKVGQFVAKLRGMAAEFRSSFDEMARQSELDDLRKEVEAMRRGDPLKAAVGTGDIDSVFKDIDTSLHEGGVSMSPAMMTYQHPVEPEGPLAEPEVAPVKAASKPKAVSKPKAAPKPRAGAKPAAKRATAARTPTVEGAKPPRKRAAKPQGGTVT